MHTLKRISRSSASNAAAVNIIFLAEAYQENQYVSFLQDCRFFQNYIQKVYPFNLLNIAPVIEFYSHFEPSANSTIQANGEGTSLKSKITEGHWLFDDHKVSNKIDNLELYWDEEKESLSYLLNKGETYNRLNRTLVCILSPSTAFGEDKEMVYESSPNEDAYYFVATSTHKQWPQVIIRSLGKILGLGDEFASSTDLELDTDDFTEIDAYYTNELTPNLYYGSRTSIGIKKGDLKWRNVLGATTQQKDIEISNNDSNIPFDKPYSDIDIGLYEGGGGYKSNVFRGCPDCLMRINLKGDYTRIFNETVPFCPVCTDFILTELKQLLRDSGDSVFTFRQNLIIL